MSKESRKPSSNLRTSSPANVGEDKDSDVPVSPWRVPGTGVCHGRYALSAEGRR